MRRLPTLSSLLFASVAASALLAAQPALADTADATDATASQVGELVVTAERRTETVLEVPATVTAISGQALRDQGITNIKQIIEMVPNAVLPDDPENFETYINIRGIHQADINAEPNFGLYRNGIFAGGERANLGAQVDIDRVEVLSGPQSGLYGRDAVGGTVNVIYAMPTLDNKVSGYAIGDYGNWNRTQLQGAVNVPISPTFAVRAAGWWFNQTQGQLYDPTLNQYVDRFRDAGVRLSARWDPSNRLSVVWMLEYQDKNGPSFEGFAPVGLTDQFGIPCCGFPSTGPESPSNIPEDTANTEHWDQTYLTQDLTYDTGGWAGSFELLAAYKNYHLHLQEDQDHTAFGVDSFPADLMQIQYRDEALQNVYVEGLWKSPADKRLTWIAGIDGFDETFKFDRIFAGSTNFNLLNTPFAGPGFTYGNLLCSFLMAPYDGGCEAFGGSPGEPGAGAGQFPYLFPNIGVQSAANAFGLPGSSIDTTAASAFATATFKFTDAFSITGDLRIDWLQKALNYSQGPAPGYGGTAISEAYLDPIFAQIFPAFSVQQTKSWVNVAPSVNLKYKFSANANAYLSYAQGFRAGGFNLSTSSPQFLPYGPERDYSVELGFKSVWMNGRLTANADVFYMHQSDLVLTESDPTEPSFLGLYYLANVGTARTYGVEFQGAFAPTTWLSTGVTVGWLDDKFDGGTSHGVAFAGQAIPLTRNWTINLNATVNYPITDSVHAVGDITERLEYGGWLPASVSTLETARYPNFNSLDIDAGVSFGKTRITGYVANALNDIIPQFEYSDGEENVNVGRTYGVRIEQKF
ncbi:MAG TPA: TonB-dependent receptor [Caulobacteraceae bacterium]|nr:TonB-dependent receptor [Caulobacteraceae bacterium]